jgi:hypothetical protein
MLSVAVIAPAGTSLAVKKRSSEASESTVKVRLDGTVTTGGVVSAGALTVTVKLAVPTFPAASVAVHVTVVVPTENIEPEADEQVGPEVMPILSVALKINDTVLPEVLNAETDMSTGTSTTGRVVSVSEPEPVELEPEPVEVEPEPVELEPEPVEVEPEPVELEPEPVEVEPEPVELFCASASGTGSINGIDGGTKSMLTRKIPKNTVKFDFLVTY